MSLFKINMENNTSRVDLTLERSDYTEGMQDFTHFYINASNEADFLYTKIARISISLILPIFFTIGVIGNLGLLVVFVRIRTLRNSINIYLLNVAACDFCFLVTAGPILWTNFSNSPVEDDFYHVGIVACKFNIFVVEACIVVSYWTFMFVTIERYLSICWPMRFRNLENPKRAVLLCVGLWIITSAYRSPMLYFSTLFTVDLTWTDTTIIDPSAAPKEVAYCLICDGRPGQPTELACEKIHKLYIGEHIILVGTVPVFVFMYISMIVSLRIQLSKQRQSNRAVVEAKKHVIAMLMVTTFVLLITTAPARALLIILATQKVIIPQPVIVTILYVSKCSMFVNASVNPFIYIIMSTSYRNAFKKCFLSSVCLGDTPVGEDHRKLKSSKAPSSLLSLNTIGKKNVLIDSQSNLHAIK